MHHACLPRGSDGEPHSAVVQECPRYLKREAQLGSLCLRRTEPKNA
jgi:hypothetical protein